ncbi:MAG: hypothetical protein VYB54_03105 [Pseudomonadota bacterium]|nr:hypothetical protein [Pseudomonadota bacterium]
MSNTTRTPKVVATRFSMLARRDPGISREEIIKRGNAAVSDLKPMYVGWVEEYMHTLDELVCGARDAEEFLGERASEAYRIANQIRNLGETFEHPAATGVADSYCELLRRLTVGKHYDRRSLIEHLNALKLVCSPEFRASPNDVNDLLQALQLLVDRFPDPDADARAAQAAARAALVKS